MADLWRLQNAVAGVHHQRRTLVFVNHPDPARLAKDHLEADSVIVHVIWHLTTLGNTNVGSDKPPAQAAGDEVAILHAGAASAPGIGATQPADDELLLALGNFNRQFGLGQFDLH